jgi:hypothetical protein
MYLAESAEHTELFLIILRELRELCERLLAKIFFQTDRLSGLAKTANRRIFNTEYRISKGGVATRILISINWGENGKGLFL